VYLMKDKRGVVLYVGKAASLRARVASYFTGETTSPKTASMLERVAEVSCVEMESEVDALLAEARLIKDLQPKYNISLRDSKMYPFLEITREEYPTVRVTRRPEAASKVYGPFVRAANLRYAVKLLQKVFTFRTCDLNISSKDDNRKDVRPCLLGFIDCCSAPCAERITKEDYRRSVWSLRRVLDGNKKYLVRTLTRQMEGASRRLEYEKAAELRDQLYALKAVEDRGVSKEFMTSDYLEIDFGKAAEELKRVLALERPVRVIEGIDISNIGGEEATGSVVYFIDGRPVKQGYRRYRIKTVEGSDDCAMIREVVARRYGRLEREERPLPDLTIIDGGKGQLEAAVAGLAGLREARRPQVISIAKKEEIVFVPGWDDGLRLPRRSVGLRLIQYVRDEAHRFALHYHHILHRKKVLEE